MAGQFEGKVALVTGAGSGIGRATALAFAREGARVVVADVSAVGGEETTRQIKDAGGEALFVPADVARASDVEALVNTVVASYGRLDYAHNNAGIATSGVPLHELEEEVWDQVLAVNLKGVWLCMKYEIRRMLRQGGGVIVNTASVAGLRGFPGNTAYGASKHGVVGLTRIAALNYAHEGIRVNAVCPGFIRTHMTLGDTIDLENEARMAGAHPMGRMGIPEEVAAAVVWLCSDAAAFVTGLAMPIDGGYTAK
jgi:NAD(P)-dependent dehydrogenase (short-subunit alcohol dehydrogenase family)